MNTIKKEIVNFGNTLMSVPGGEIFILDSFATMYIALKNAKCDVKNPKYQLLNTLFENLGVIPKMGENGEIIYEDIEKKENPFEKVENKKDNKDFFKRKNQNNLNNSKCANCKYKNYCTHVLYNSGEKDLIDDILFSFEKEIGGLICTFNKL